MNSMDRYIKKFQTGNDVQDAVDNLELLKPYTAYVVEGDYIDWNSKKRSYKNNYLTFVALEDTKYSFSSGLQYSLQYSTDNGNSWNTLSASQKTPTIQSGNKVLWKGNIYSTPINYGAIFSSTGRYSIEGNIMSLRYGDNFKNQVILSEPYIFRDIFKNNTKLISAENLVLPATTLTERCYDFMFYGCTSLTTAPSLPATTLAKNCYEYMFYNCTSLTTAPSLPATTLANNCYQFMFQNCTSLTTAPVLPATILADSCYQYMFQNCTSLTTAPELPATTLADRCYGQMFFNCTSLTTAPELPATTLADYCYSNMFNGCTSLTTAPVLPATTLASNCYNGMFAGCTSLTTAPELPATTLAQNCYNNMFLYCNKLNYIKCLATDISAGGCTGNWVFNVSSTGTFVKNANMTGWTTGYNGIPNGWTVQDA